MLEGSLILKLYSKVLITEKSAVIDNHLRRISIGLLCGLGGVLHRLVNVKWRFPLNVNRSEDQSHEATH